MPKRYQRKRRGFGGRRPRGIRRSKARVYASRIRRGAFRHTARKYTRIYTLSLGNNEKDASLTISHFGGQGAADSNRVVCLTENNVFSNLAMDAARYTSACITGVSYKILMPTQTGDADYAVSHWSLAYSPSEIIEPGVAGEALQTLTGYQSGNSTGPISRYFNTARARKAQGVDWMPSGETVSMSDPNKTLYNGQLPAGKGACSHIRISRLRASEATPDPWVRVQVTYYVKWRGEKGNLNV